MNTRSIIKIGISILIYTLLQVLFFRNLVIFDVAFCFVYISVFLFLPNNTPTTAVLIIAFLTGLTVDIFYNTGGLQASAALLSAYSRNRIINLMFTNRGLDNEVIISVDELGVGRLIRYILVMVLIHHTYLFLVEAGSFGFVEVTILKIISSTLFSTLVIFLMHVFFKSLRNL